VTVDAFEIDSQPVSWARYLAYVEATGPRRRATCAGPERPGKPASFGVWQALDPDTAAGHLT
jgi:formylglycine-generating enzyme required for sulfatase activity